MAKSKKDKTMAEVTDGYETFIKGKKVNKTGGKKFDNTLKATTKQRGSK